MRGPLRSAQLVHFRGLFRLRRWFVYHLLRWRRRCWPRCLTNYCLRRFGRKVCAAFSRPPRCGVASGAGAGRPGGSSGVAQHGVEQAAQHRRLSTVLNSRRRPVRSQTALGQKRRPAGVPTLVAYGTFLNCLNDLTRRLKSAVDSTACAGEPLAGPEFGAVLGHRPGNSRRRLGLVLGAWTKQAASRKPGWCWEAQLGWGQEPEDSSRGVPQQVGGPEPISDLERPGVCGGVGPTQELWNAPGSVRVAPGSVRVAPLGVESTTCSPRGLAP